MSLVLIDLCGTWYFMCLIIFYLEKNSLMYVSVNASLLCFQHLVALMCRLAYDNIGYIDWSPYISKVNNQRSYDIVINHSFQCSNIRWITRKAFEYKAAGSNPFRVIQQMFEH